MEFEFHLAPHFSRVRLMDILTDVVFAALDEAQDTLPTAERIGRRADAVLFGDGGFDSMGLVQFIVIVEERIEDTCGVELRLASDKAMSQRRSPFATTGALAAFIETLLAEARGG